MEKMDYIHRLDKMDRTGEHSDAGPTPSLTSPADGSQNGKAASAPKVGYQDRFWIPRFWNGMNVTTCFAFVARNRFAVSPLRVAMVLINCGLSFINSALWLLEIALFGRKIKRTKLEQDPIFVIGHWRSGTTLLHELLVRDPRHTYPDTYACFAPTHFLVSSWLIKPCLKFLLPSRRPTDNMAAGWDHPQEDEFALCNMGALSPYLTIAFPNRPPQCQDYFDFRGVPEAALHRWKSTLLWFLKCVTVQNPKRIVLKSPPHTCRIRALLEMFPKAKFVHIVRDPSTVSLWKRLYRDEGWQLPKYHGLDEHVFDTLTRMYEAFDRDRPLLGDDQFCEVRYEDLVANPVGQMQAVYERFGLGGFESVRPAIEAYFANQKDYKTSHYQLEPELRAEITRRWGKFIQRYGYAAEPAAREQAAVGR
jgi:hypothetical protein